MGRPAPYGIERIVTGGQTGVDRAAWDAAHACGIPIGGYVPKGRMAEDGPIPADYGRLTETESTDPAERTRLNVEHSDKTLILTRGPLTGGTALTAEVAEELGKPFLIADLDRLDEGAAIARIAGWLDVTPGTLLNVAGPRFSEDCEINRLAGGLLEKLLRG